MLRGLQDATQAVRWAGSIALPAIPCLFHCSCNAWRGRFSSRQIKITRSGRLWPMLARLKTLATQDIASLSTN
jgi:hypothetical protein